MRADETTTIEQFIKSEKDVSMTYQKLSFVDTMEDGTEGTTFNVIHDYIDELLDSCINVKLSETEQNAYLYKPKLLCYDIYGNPELYYIILLLNDMADVKEFTKSTIKMLKKNDMSTLLSYIYNAEREALDEYNYKQK